MKKLIEMEVHTHTAEDMLNAAQEPYFYMIKLLNEGGLVVDTKHTTKKWERVEELMERWETSMKDGWSIEVYEMVRAKTYSYALLTAEEEAEMIGDRNAAAACGDGEDDWFDDLNTPEPVCSSCGAKNKCPVFICMTEAEQGVQVVPVGWEPTPEGRLRVAAWDTDWDDDVTPF